MNRKYSPEMRERALRMLAEARPEHATMMPAIRHVAGLLGMSPETLRLRRRRYEIVQGFLTSRGFPPTSPPAVRPMYRGHAPGRCRTSSPTPRATRDHPVRPNRGVSTPTTSFASADGDGRSLEEDR